MVCVYSIGTGKAAATPKPPAVKPTPVGPKGDFVTESQPVTGGGAYAVDRYHGNNEYSYYDIERESHATGNRMPQPSPNVPDTPRD